MAKLSRDDVLKLAKLSSLQLSDDEVSEYMAEIEAILGYVEQLQAIDLSKFDPTYQVTGLQNVEREDTQVDYHVSPEDLLKNVPEVQDGYIKVQRVLE